MQDFSGQWEGKGCGREVGRRWVGDRREGWWVLLVIRIRIYIYISIYVYVCVSML